MEDKITTTMYEKEEKTFPVWPCVTQERRYIGRKSAIHTAKKESKRILQDSLDTSRVLMYNCVRTIIHRHTKGGTCIGLAISFKSSDLYSDRRRDRTSHSQRHL